MKLFSQDGIEMMDVQSIKREGDVLVLKGKMMGAMATTIHLKPEYLYEAFQLLKPYIFSLPLLLLKGCPSSEHSAQFAA